MRNRRKPVSLIALLLVFCVAMGISISSLHLSFAASPATRLPAKDTSPITPMQLKPHTIPGATISIYEPTTNAATMQAQGCSAARRAPGLIVLDWGQPVYFGNGIYGTYDFGGHDDTDGAILHAVANFATGVWSCRTASTNIALAIGQSNYYSGNAIPLTTAAWYADGQQWGTMVNTVQSFLTSNHYTVIAAHGAGDMEVEWASFALTKSLVDGYNSVTSRLFFDFGDASVGWWTNYQLWYIAYGAKDNVPLPEIYYTADATYDWAVLDRWACNNMGAPMYFKGVMSEDLAGSDSPTQAFNDLYNALASNSCTAKYLSGMIFSTQIYHT